MSSKTGKPEAETRQPFSLTFRLTLLYSLSVLVILSFTCGILYWGLVQRLNERNRVYVASQIAVLEALLRNQDPEPLRTEVRLEHSYLEYLKHYVRILDGEWRPLMETEGMSKHLPVDVFPDPATETYRTANFSYRQVDGSYYVLQTVVTDNYAKEARILQVALDVTEIFRLRREYLNLIAAVLLVGIVCTGAAGIYTAETSLRPLHRLSEAIGEVSASTLGERVPREGWPREIRLVAETFNHMLDRLQDSFERLSNCTSNLAHELRTPITNLRGEAEIALTRTRPAEEYRAVIESSLEEYARLAKMIDALMFLTWCENAAVPVRYVSLDLRKELEKLVDFYEGVAEQKGNTIELMGEGVVTADRSLFHRAVGHVLTNALTYTRDGTITVSVSDDPLGATVTVSDTGCGISPEHLPQVFDRFFRVDATRKMDPHGFGLGLTTVRAIMDLHGGYATISSNPGVGTTVTLFFPAVDLSVS
jgi:two-component system, OmpR family, heavy metal sensor histidine kinase CusS